MTLLTGLIVRSLLVSIVTLWPVLVCAQSPAPPPPPAQEEQADPDKPAPAPTPKDDGPKPAGVGPAQPPSPADPLDEDEEETVQPPATGLFPGMPEPGTTPSQRPFSGLFAGAEPTNRRRDTLTASGSVYGGYSTNVAPLLGDGTLAPGESSTLYGGNGALDYGKWWRLASFRAYASGSRTYLADYPVEGEPWLSRWDTGVDGDVAKRIGQRVNVSASGFVSYSPYLSFNTFDLSSGGVGNLPVAGAGLDYILARDPNVTTSAVASFSYALTRRSSLEAYYDSRYQTFVDSEPKNPDRAEYWIGGRYRYQFGQFVGVRGGYGYRSVQFDTLNGPATTIANHYLDVGADAGYGKSYALTRRTTFAFSTNTGLFVDQEVGSDADVETRTRTRLFVGGLADLTHTIGRSWAARVGYRRDVQYEPGFTQPLLSDTGHASLGGLLTERLDFNATAYLTGGQVGFGGSDNGYRNASAVASLRFAVSRNLAAYANYFYYSYEFEQGVTLPSYLQPDLERQGVSVGLTALVPVIGSRGRR